MTGGLRRARRSADDRGTMLRPADTRWGTEMKKLISDLAQAFAWIWMTPEQALVLVRERDVSWEIEGARGAYSRGAYAKAA